MASKLQISPSEAESNGVPQVDENGVDLSLIDYMLSLTPAQRLQQLEAMATFVLEARHARGIDDTVECTIQCASPEAA